MSDSEPIVFLKESTAAEMMSRLGMNQAWGRGKNFRPRMMASGGSDPLYPFRVEVRKYAIPNSDPVEYIPQWRIIGMNEPEQGLGIAGLVFDQYQRQTSTISSTGWTDLADGVTELTITIACVVNQQSIAPTVYTINPPVENVINIPATKVYPIANITVNNEGTPAVTQLQFDHIRLPWLAAWFGWPG